MKKENIERLNRNSASVLFMDWLCMQENCEFRIAKQNDRHYVIHPLNEHGKTFDLKWDDKISKIENHENNL